MEMLDSDSDSLSLPPIYEDAVPDSAAALARLSLRDPAPPLPSGRQPAQGDETRPAEPPSPDGGGGGPVTSTPGPRPAQSRCRRPPLADNTYYGLARHCDGSQFSESSCSGLVAHPTQGRPALTAWALILSLCVGKGNSVAISHDYPPPWHTTRTHIPSRDSSMLLRVLGRCCTKQ